MKRNYQLGILLLLLGTIACGDAGIGFNITRKIAVDFNVSVTGNDPSIETDRPEFNRPFRLTDVGAFEDVLSDLADADGVVINSITYSISEVSPDEEVSLDQITLSVASVSAEQINVLGITGTLQNTPETTAGVSAADTETIQEILKNFKEVDNRLTFDFAEVPTSDLDFIFTLYYDVTLRVRF